ncbi:MAG: PAS domain S-box protein [Leptolyngbyaceae cyanobacterium SM1_4_3]|nr:PAS domain S-box protein [Leptolyngbyaceae cyanobacterium SM1_4_3]
MELRCGDRLALMALLLMLAVDPYLQVRNTTFLIFHTALTLAAWYGGRNAGILATVLSAMLATYFFVDPIPSLNVTFASGARILIFVLQGCLISVLVGALRTAQQQSKRSLRLQEAAFYEQRVVLRELQQAEEILRRSEERQAFLLKLNDTLRPLSDAEEIQHQAACVLGEYLGANRVAYFEVRGADYVVEQDYVNGADALAGRYPIDSFGDRLLAAYRTGRTVSSSNVAGDPDLAPEQQSAYAAIQIGAYIGVPLVKAGEFVAGVAVHTIAPRGWKPEEIALAEEVAARTWSAVERARAEAALRDRENMLGGIIGSITDALMMIDKDWRYTFANEEFLHRIGMSLADVIGNNVWELFPAAIGNEAYTQLHRAVAERISVEYEVFYAPFQRWYSDKAYPTADGGLAIYSRDITEAKRDEVVRKQAEVELAENEACLRGFVEANVVGILYGDIYGNIFEANDELLRIVGYTREDLQAGRLRWLDLTPPEYLPLDAERIAEARDRGACTPYEKEYIRKDGSRVPVLIGYSLVGSAREESVAFILDLTDRKQAEQERERSLQREQTLRQQAEIAERRLDALLESIRDGFVLFDHNWCVVYLNSQATLSMQNPATRS